jgi:hypothetical protein
MRVCLFADEPNEATELIDGILNADHLRGAVDDVRKTKMKIDEIRGKVSDMYAEIISTSMMGDGCAMQ